MQTHLLYSSLQALLTTTHSAGHQQLCPCQNRRYSRLLVGHHISGWYPLFVMFARCANETCTVIQLGLVVSMQDGDGSTGAIAGDDELAGLLTAWYNAGFETGRHHEKRRLQMHLPQDTVRLQPVI